MSDAVRGDFERLRARRERSAHGGQTPPVERPERLVLTRPRAVEEADADPSPPAEHVAEEAPEQARPWLRSVFRRR